MHFAREVVGFGSNCDQAQSTPMSIDIATETIEGLGLAGPEKWVKSLTGSLKLLR
jgi:hypothetical protein